MITKNFKLKLIDFGCSKTILNNSTSNLITQGNDVGTINWRAPETFPTKENKGKPICDEKSKIFILYQL
jgi:serine/threonine protein kinase